MSDRRWTKPLPTVLGTLGALALALLIVVFTGAYDIGATSGHAGVTDWLLSTVMERSVSTRAGELDQPLPADSASLAHGLEHFHAMCVVCHGAPGVERGEFGKGMTPRPPRLSRAAREWSDAELVWIIENGIKLAGMPAFAPTHGREEIRQIAALVRRLPELDSATYARLIEGMGGGASHGHGAPAQAGTAADTDSAAPDAGDVHIHSDGNAHVH